MPNRRLVWRLFFSYLAIIVLCTLVLGLVARDRVATFHHEEKVLELEKEARLIAPQIGLALERGSDLEAFARLLGDSVETHLTVVRPDGRVIADSRESLANLESHADRPEIAAALQGRVGHAIRPSGTFSRNMMYVAVPLTVAGQTYAVRTSYDLDRTDEALGAISRRIMAAALAIVAAAALVAYLLARRVSAPLEEMRLGAARFARGELEHRLPIWQRDEFGDLAAALNSMAQQLNERLRALTRQQNEQQTVLSSMAEGVLAVDAGKRIILINDAACELLGLNDQPLQGHTLPEVVRNAELQDFVTRTRAALTPLESEVTLRQAALPGGGDTERRLALHGTLLRDDQDRQIGVLVVLSDVTRLRRLEQVRREFVANVSHELKTPITAIQGFLETLREGAIDEPEKARQFLGIMSRQVERLSAIIEDLLALSRIEQGTEQRRIEMATGRIDEVLQVAVSDGQAKAAAKQITIKLESAGELCARVNRELLAQAVWNLMDNAVKYSEPGSQIQLWAERRGNEIMIRVRDFGYGIPAEHLPRIFERFYCVDPARSRKLGGTGLGLAIVKHIVQAHGGRVTVESAPGRGSTFTIHLPTACDC